MSVAATSQQSFSPPNAHRYDPYLASMTKDPYRGRLLADRYQIVELVGKGAMGRVYRAEDTLLGGVTVAIKFISQALLNEKRRVRFEQEAKICALLGERSIHIVQVRDYGVDKDDVPFYAMEFLDGQSLSQVIKPRPLPITRFLKVARQICLGLQCAHQGIFFEGESCPIVHRDIKPSNILILQDANLGELVKILDFGIAKLLQSNNAQTHSFQGTLAYCSPEQMEGRELDSRSDIYSLGIMMYEMLTGDMPILPENNSFGSWYQAHRYDPPDPISPDLGVPPLLADLVMQCMAKSPQERPQKVSDILRILAPLEHQLEKNNKIRVPRADPNERNLTQGSSLPEARVPENQAFLLRVTWPQSKPVGKIVFPRAIDSPQGSIPSLWVMLEKRDLENRIVSRRYNQFLYLMSPHPMILWITALYNREHGVRWLPCYLDLKTRSGRQIARELGEMGYYRILFFALEEPPACQHIMTSSVATAQRQKLSDWARTGPSWQSTGNPQLSKQILKREFEELKPRIQAKLDAVGTDAPSNFSEV